MLKVMEREVVPWCEDKLHSKKVVQFIASKGVQIYPGGGKNPWVRHICPLRIRSFEDREENGYPPRSHDFQPAETELAKSFADSQEDLEIREKNAGKKRSMLMWKNALVHTWHNRPMEET